MQKETERRYEIKTYPCYSTSHLIAQLFLSGQFCKALLNLPHSHARPIHHQRLLLLLRFICSNRLGNILPFIKPLFSYHNSRTTSTSTIIPLPNNPSKRSTPITTPPHKPIHPNPNPQPQEQIPIKQPRRTLRLLRILERHPRIPLASSRFRIAEDLAGFDGACRVVLQYVVFQVFACCRGVQVLDEDCAPRWVVEGFARAGWRTACGWAWKWHWVAWEDGEVDWVRGEGGCWWQAWHWGWESVCVEGEVGVDVMVMVVVVMWVRYSHRGKDLSVFIA